MTAPAYEHTQVGRIHWLLIAIALVCGVSTVLTLSTPPAALITGGVAAVMVLCALCFARLTVADAGDRLAIRFGPLPFFRTSVPYEDIERVEVGRTLLLDGLGIHYSLRGGWVWNLWGRECVVLYRRGGPMWVGTDDAEGLAAFLRGRVGRGA